MRGRPPFAGGLIGHSNDGNDTKPEERRTRMSETVLEVPT
jgi:hypothetical protein